MNKSFTTHEQLMNKSKTNCEQVVNKYCTSNEENGMNKDRQNYYSGCRVYGVVGCRVVQWFPTRIRLSQPPAGLGLGLGLSLATKQACFFFI